MTGLRGWVDRYDEQVIDVDSLLRQFSETPDPPRVEACMKTLHQANEEYLKTGGEAYEGLRKLQADGGIPDSAAHKLQTAFDSQTQRIELVQAAVESMDYEGDLAGACKQMTGHTTRLADANHVLRDVLVQTRAAVSTAETRQTPEVEKFPGGGVLAKLADQAGLAASLASLRNAGTQPAQPLCVAAIDLDHFSRINERYGPKAGDRILQALAQLLITEGSHNNIVGRASGQQFAILFPDTDLRFTTSVVERIRQMVEMSHFQCGSDDIQITVSCAVVEARLQDDFPALLARAEAAIQEAKRYGRNRTFLYEGEYPTPVVPPNFALEEKSITV